jgi:hypothetical protein
VTAPPPAATLRARAAANQTPLPPPRAPTAADLEPPEPPAPTAVRAELARTLVSLTSPGQPAPRGTDTVVVAPAPPVAAPEPGESEPAAGAAASVGTAALGAADEDRLAREFEGGSLAAGIALARHWQGRARRARELVALCRRLVLLAPGDLGLLERLEGAASADGNTAYASAVGHVRHAMLDEALPAPPLLAQPEQPERVRLMLFREGAVQEALALVWEGAAHVFKREPSAYGVTGVERVPFWAPSPVARVYGAAARTLGIAAPLFQRRVPGDITLTIALLHSPSIIVNGELPRPSPEFAFHLGVMLAAAMPGHALLCGAPEDQARSVLRALAMAFGPPTASRSGLTAVANLAEVLWESMPTRSQRRLRQLCDEPQGLVYETAMAEVRAATRRAGLFVAGDLRVAVREVAAELGISLDRGLGAACTSSPELFDLYRLATSPEYAESRWQPARLTSRPPEGIWVV